VDLAVTVLVLLRPL